MMQNCIMGEAWCQLPTTSGPCGLNELPYAMCVCHSEGDRFETSVLGGFLSNGFFKDNTGQHECPGIAP